jgi:plastocyanin
MNLDQISAAATSAGSLITVTTELDHGLQVGATVEIAGVITTGYNGTYGINTIINENTFTVVAAVTLGASSAVLTNLPRVTLKNWHGASVRMGAFDDQNGLFWEFDGQELAVVKRSSTYQISGFCTVTPGSQSVTATSGRFTQQLKVGDRIVIRGMTYMVGTIADDNNLTINPAYRGVNSSTGIKIATVIDYRIPQSQFNIDALDGTGISGYNINLNKMQMMGISFSWYGAGFIDFMCRGSDGNMILAHRMKQNNLNDEAYMRSGNTAVRYQTINESVNGELASSIGSGDTTITLKDVSRFPANGGVVLIENEAIVYTGINTATNQLLNCGRGNAFTIFIGGTNKTFYAGDSAGHSAGNGHTSVLLISCTASPTLNHWGSSYIMDGGFDTDRGYYFSYSSLNQTIPRGDAHTVFFIRLAPSVSNSISGTLGDRDLVNRSQLLLQKLQVQSDQSVQVYGILNPGNINSATDLTWNSVNTVALGSQPSFAQVAEGLRYAAEPGEQIFSTLGQPGGFSEIDLSALKELSNSAIGGYNNFPDGPDVLAIVVKPLPTGITSYEVGNTSSTSYRLNGYANPAITVVRGQTYTFEVNASGHPFWIKTAQTTGTGDAYSTGVTNNGDDVGIITWTVDLDAPSTLYYICQNHSAMKGTITVVDGTAANVNVNLFWSEAQA